MEQRPRVRWHHASADLADFAMVSWAADPDRVAAHLPDGFEPDVREGVTLVSLVAFRDHPFHFRFARQIRLSAGQVNYRTYVRHKGQTGVWFFGTSLASRLAHLRPRHGKCPGITKPSTSRQPGRERRHAPGDCTLTAVGEQPKLRCVAWPTMPPPLAFATDDEISRIVIDPALGWYDRRDGTGTGRYSVWHEPLTLEDARVESAHSQVLTDLGLISAGQAPCHAGLQRRSVFDIHTPPRRQSS